MKTKILISILIGMLVIPFVSAVLAIPANDNASGVERVPVLIGFTQTPGPSEQALVRGQGGMIKYTYHLVPAIAAWIPEPAIEALQKNPNVTTIEPDITVYAVDVELDNTWGVERIGAGVVHDAGNKGAGVMVAIIDSGIDYTHSDLNDNYAGGWDFVNNDNDPMDDDGHGTHVAGTVAAEDDGVGVVGVAPEAWLYSLKVLDAGGSGSYSDVIAALQWAADNGIEVTNNSYGSSGDPGDTVKAAFDNCLAVHVCAAGNSGNPPGRGDNVIYPAKYASCIAVAATNQDDERATWSSTGPDVELAAPGVGINSTLLGGGYGGGSGTSMASPHVAGTAVLLIANGVWDVRGTLSATADDLGPTGRDSKYGYGLVDADEAGLPEGPENDPPTVSITSPADGSEFNSGATILFEGTASDTEDGNLTGSLVWTSSIDDQIGTGGSFSTTLNDGTHTITASVTDSGGKTGSASISITVGTPPPTPTLSVTVTTDKDTYTLGERVKITVTVTDDVTSAPVEGAVVHCQITTFSGRKYAGNGTTDTNGEVVFEFKIKRPDGKGLYEVVANASKSEYEPGSGSTTFEVQ